MLDFGLKLAKESFFDRARVVKGLDAGKRKALSKIGAFMRTRMKTLTGKRPGKKARGRGETSAAPGQPPFRHAGQVHDLIYFVYDANTKSVVIGPTQFNAPANAFNPKPKPGEATKLLEFGGSAERADPRSGKPVTARYRGNPFAGPSLKAEIAAGTIPAAFGGVVRS